VTIRRLTALLSIVAGALAGLASLLLPAGAAPAGAVVVVPLRGTIDEASARLVRRAIGEAASEQARAVVLDLDTTQALPLAAEEIAAAVEGSTVPVDAYVTRASSPGALVALAAAHVAMAPDATIGEAQPIGASARDVAALRQRFAATAAARGRSPAIAAAMVDPAVPMPRYEPPGTLLVLTADQAVDTGFAEATAPSLDAALAGFGLAGAPRADATYGFPERVARVATSPDVSGLLLAIGFLGLLVELQTLHLVAGAIGAAALALFFGTHVYGGFSDPLVVIAALFGLALILLELHVLPGHGIPGVAGLVLLVGAVVFAFGLSFVFVGLEALAIAIVLSAAAFALVRRFIPENAFVKRLMFAGVQGSDYVASADYRSLLGKSGVAISFLRPTGLATFGDTRVDVLTEGDFVPAGTPVRVTRVEGSRIFVRPLEGRP